MIRTCGWLFLVNVFLLGQDYCTQLHPEQAKARALHQLEAMRYHVTLNRAN